MHLGGNPPSNPMPVGGSMGNVGQPGALPGIASSQPQGQLPMATGQPPATMNVNQGMPQPQMPMARPMPMQAPMVQQLSRALAPQLANRFSRAF